MNFQMLKFIVDTRNQDDSFVIKGLESLGFKMGRDIIRSKLPFGDIALASNILNAIDFKSSGGGLLELSGNICSKDHKRVKEEITKCLKFGGQLTFLCFETERDPEIKTINDVHKWRVPVYKSNIYKTMSDADGNTERILLHKKGELYTKIKPETLQKAMMTMSEPNHYGDNSKINFEFTNKKNCAIKILQLLI